MTTVAAKSFWRDKIGCSEITGSVSAYPYSFYVDLGAFPEWRQAIQRTFVDALVDAGIWDRLDVLIVPLLIADATDQKLDWKNPDRLTEWVNGATDNALAGGTAQALYVDFNPRRDGVNFQNNDCSFGVAAPDSGTEMGAVCANDGTTAVRLGQLGWSVTGAVAANTSLDDTQLYINLDGAQARCDVLAVVNTIAAETTTVYGANNNYGSPTKWYEKRVHHQRMNYAHGLPPDAPVFVGALTSLNDEVVAPYRDQAVYTELFFMGGGLTDEQLDVLYSSWYTYKIAMLD